MKTHTGPMPGLYPRPLPVTGAMNGEKPGWTPVAQLGIIGHGRVPVSLAHLHR